MMVIKPTSAISETASLFLFKRGLEAHHVDAEALLHKLKQQETVDEPYFVS